MARNGSGTYVLPAGNPVVTGSTISSTWANNTLNDIASALTGSISKDGQTTPTGNLPMGGYNHTGVADATARNQYASAGQVQDGAFTLLSTVSGTDTITATANLGMASYTAGQRFNFVSAGANTGAVTININSIGAKSITKNGTNALAAGDIQSGAVVQIVYDGTQFQMVSPTLTVSSFSGGTTGLTPSTATTGAITLAGTLAVANGGTGVTTSTGTGSVVLSSGATLSSPTLTTPALGTPSAIVLTNATGTANSLDAGVGVNQTWTNVTGSRSINTTYTNSTGKAIQVNISFNSVNGSGTLTIAGTTVAESGVVSGSGNSFVTGIVPNGATYSVADATVRRWVELR